MRCWLQELVCSLSDIVPGDESCLEPPNPSAMFATITALLAMHEELKRKQSAKLVESSITNVKDSIPATNTKVIVRKAPSSLDLTNVARKRKYTSVKFSPLVTKEVALTGIIEECEYDSDIGKFLCRDTSDSDPDSLKIVQEMNDLNAPPLNCVKKIVAGEENIVGDVLSDECDVTDGYGIEMKHYQIVMQRIDFFENTPDKLINLDVLSESDCALQKADDTNNLENCEAKLEKVGNTKVLDVPEKDVENVEKATKEICKDNRTLSQILFTVFMVALALLIVFPLPN